MARSKRKIIWDAVFLSLFAFFIVCFLLSLKGYYKPDKLSTVKPPEFADDEFDPSLMRLNSIAKLEAYCDSLYDANPLTNTYPGIVSEVIRKKFYHGYSYYNKYTNPSAAFISGITKKGMGAIVIADDIVKFPYAACSQQSIVGTEMLRRRGYQIREVTMWDTVMQGGHFAYEVLYSGEWHYFDTNKEPDIEVLKKYNRPSLAYLKAHPDIILAAYRTKGPELFRRLLLSGQTSPINKFPAPVATFFQHITKFANFFGWLIIGLVILVRYRLLARKPIVSISWLKRRQNKFQSIRSAALHGQEVRA